MYQITVIRVKYMREFVFYCKTAESSPKNVYFRPCVFPVLRMKTSINSAHSAPAVQFDHSIAKVKPDLPTGAFTVTILRDIHWWPLTSGNEAENRPVLYPKVSCCLCNVFTVIIINLKIPRKSWRIRCSEIDSIKVDCVDRVICDRWCANILTSCLGVSNIIFFPEYAVKRITRYVNLFTRVKLAKRLPKACFYLWTMNLPIKHKFLRLIL